MNYGHLKKETLLIYVVIVRKQSKLL